VLWLLTLVIFLSCRRSDASRSSVDKALSQGHRIGLSPGGIAEIFQGYPRPFTHPDEEYAILKPRKGFIRMAVKHGVPVVPVYCFGATKLLKRLQLPAFFERISNLLRISIVVFFGSWGLPVPFRQRLLYVMGEPLFPPSNMAGPEGSPQFEAQVNLMHAQFCEELKTLFDRHKESYGWQRKTLRLV
jgi:2-acylglycerol O-acyltransferase 2